MTIEQYERAQEIIQRLRAKKSELEEMKNFVKDISGNSMKVKINNQWTVNLPVAVLQGQIKARIIELGNEVASITSELNVI